MRIPKSVKGGFAIDKVNGNTIGWEAILQDTNNVIFFVLFEVNVEDLPTRYQEVGCHIVLNVNMGENFRCKIMMV